jgi:hypothetical protein
MAAPILAERPRVANEGRPRELITPGSMSLMDGMVAIDKLKAGCLHPAAGRELLDFEALSADPRGTPRAARMARVDVLGNGTS